MRFLTYFITLAFVVHSSAFGEAKKKPWVATKDNYKSNNSKNAAPSRTPDNTDDAPASKPKVKTNLKSKAATAKKSKPAEAPPSNEPPSQGVGEKGSSPTPVATVSAPTGKASVSAELKERGDDETRQYTFRIHSYLGVFINKNSGSVYGISVAIVPDGNSLWYFGPEINYSNPSAGSLMSVLAGAWRDFPIYGASRLSLGLGALLGPVFAAVGTGYPSPTYGAFINTALCKEIDELAVIRAEFRPGLVGGRFAFLMNFGVTFRFL